MITESNEQKKKQENLSKLTKESPEIDDNNNQNKPIITEDIKNLLDSLLKKTLDMKYIIY